MSWICVALEFLSRVFGCGRPAAERLEIEVGPEEPKDGGCAWMYRVRHSRREEDSRMAVIVMTSEGKRKLTLRPKSRFGRNAVVDGAPRWEVDDPTLATVEPSEDGMSAYVISVDGAKGVGKGRAKADADVGDGVEEIAEEFDIVVTPPRASTLGLEQGEEEPK